jgi:hypothetical protein
MTSVLVQLHDGWTQKDMEYIGVTKIHRYRFTGMSRIYSALVHSPEMMTRLKQMGTVEEESRGGLWFS